MNSKRMTENKIHRVLPVAAALLMMMSICGCASSDAKSEAAISADEDIPVVVSTIFPGYDLARNIGGDKAVVIQLLAPGAESHTYEPTPQDMLLIRQCDVFIYAGGESDTWIEDILSDDDAPSRIVVSMLDACEALEEEEIEGMHEGGILSELFSEEEEEYDEHTWTSPVNAMKICDAICDAMCEASGANTGYFRENRDAYNERLKDLDNRYRDSISKIPSRKIVVADRFPFRYLCEEYGIEYRAAFPGCSDNAEIIPESLITLCDYVEANEIPVVFTIEFSSGKIADSVCEVTGAKKMLLHSCHNVSDMSESYIDIMNSNLENLLEAMSQHD